MFCGKCGKETGAGGFCPHCGAAVKKSEGNVTPVPVTTREKERKAGKKGKHIGHYLILMLLIVGAGGLYLYFTGDSYRCRKFLKQAEAYLEDSTFQKAVSYHWGMESMDLKSSGGLPYIYLLMTSERMKTPA